MSFQRAALAIGIALVCTLRGKTADPQRSTQIQSGTATITGTVVTLSSGEPIADASVSLYESTLPDGRISTTTDSQGRFQFNHLPPGRYQPVAEVDYPQRTLRADIRVVVSMTVDDQPSSVDLAPEPRCCAANARGVAGRVRCSFSKGSSGQRGVWSQDDHLEVNKASFDRSQSWKSLANISRHLVV